VVPRQRGGKGGKKIASGRILEKGKKGMGEEKTQKNKKGGIALPLNGPSQKKGGNDFFCEKKKKGLNQLRGKGVLAQSGPEKGFARGRKKRLLWEGAGLGDEAFPLGGKKGHDASRREGIVSFLPKEKGGGGANTQSFVRGKKKEVREEQQ